MGKAFFGRDEKGEGRWGILRARKPTEMVILTITWKREMRGMKDDNDDVLRSEMEQLRGRSEENVEREGKTNMKTGE